MTLCSYEYQSEIQYDYRVLHPQIDLMNRGLQFQQNHQRQLYSGGVHFCPTCTGQELRNLGQYEESGWLFDRSSFNQSDTNKKVMDVLHRFGFYSDGRADPRLKVIFKCQFRRSEHYQRGRHASYAHLPGHGQNCEDFEHEIVIRRIGRAFLDALEEQYPHLQAKLESEEKIDIVNRKPDIRLRLLDKSGKILRDTAIEIQKSAIDLETFQQRTRDLKSVLSGVIWVFRQSGVSGRFLAVVRDALTQGIPVFSYDIEGEPYSDDCNIRVAQITEADLPERKGMYGGQKSIDPARCDRAEESQKGQQSHRQRKPRVSARSRVILDYSRPTLFQTIVPPNLRFTPGMVAKHQLFGKRVRVKEIQDSTAICYWIDEVVPLCRCYWPLEDLIEID